MNKDFNAEFSENKNSISEEDMKLINSYSQKELKSEDVFVFSVVLCDNDIDRDFERFTETSLNTLAKLFVGKTAIKNHSMNCDDQSARTFKTEVITDSERKNALGKPYVYLKAHCYMPKIEKNESLIAEIQTGIKKEVSIGCAVAKSVCSVCGTDTRTGVCSHKKGRKYKNGICYYELDNPTDAYEWSFVAVPAQKNAGVTKGFVKKEVKDLESIIKLFESAEDEVTISKDEAEKICGYINELKSLANDGEAYRAELEDSTVKLFAFTMPDLSNDYTESICKAMSTEDLKELNHAMKKNKPSAVNTSSQLMKKNNSAEQNKNSQFRF